MAQRQKRILVALSWYDYRLHCGIAKYAQNHGWHLCADVTKERSIPWGWKGDGILAWLGAGDDLAEFVVRAKVPTVDFSFRRPELHFPRVLEDQAEAARLVATHFLSRGVTNFIFFSDAVNWAFDERGRGFVKAVAEAGHQCLWLRWHESPGYTLERDAWKKKRRWLASELRRAPKPVGVFAASDNHALEVLETCESAGLAVPEQVAIIGADNSLLAVEAMRTPISSVDTNLEVVGFRGAALLDGLMRGKRPPKEPLRVPVLGFIARKSSDLLAIPQPGVAKSLRFIWEQYSTPISVKDLVGVAAMSRRAFYTAFFEHVGRSPGQEVHRIRIERAKKLLAGADHKVAVLAKMCGYRSTTGFGVAFKQATGMSPKQYREKLRG